MTKRLAAALSVLSVLALASPSDAEEPGRREQGGAFRMPPQEAVAACASLALDAACTFTFDGRFHQGTCRRGPEGQGPIACAPDRGPKQGRGPRPGGEPGRGQEAGEGGGAPERR